MTRSASAKEYRKLYNTRRWRDIRAIQLSEHPLCQCPHCQEGKRFTKIATVVDHIKPHRGDERLFWDQGNLRSMAKECHDKFKQSEEKGGAGFKSGCGNDGQPLDPSHHWNR